MERPTTGPLDEAPLVELEQLFSVDGSYDGVPIEFASRRSSRSQDMAIFYLANRNLVCRICTTVRDAPYSRALCRFPWIQDFRRRLCALAICPDIEWVACVTSNRSIYFHPFYHYCVKTERLRLKLEDQQIDEKVTANLACFFTPTDMAMSIRYKSITVDNPIGDELEPLMLDKSLGIPSATFWWRRAHLGLKEDREVLIVGTSKGWIVFVSVFQGKELFRLDVSREITSLEVIVQKGEEEEEEYLLIGSRSGSASLLLEKDCGISSHLSVFEAKDQDEFKPKQLAGGDQAMTVQPLSIVNFDVVDRFQIAAFKADITREIAFGLHICAPLNSWRKVELPVEGGNNWSSDVYEFQELFPLFVLKVKETGPNPMTQILLLMPRPEDSWAFEVKAEMELKDKEQRPLALPPTIQITEVVDHSCLYICTRHNLYALRPLYSSQILEQLLMQRALTPARASRLGALIGLNTSGTFLKIADEACKGGITSEEERNWVLQLYRMSRARPVAIAMSMLSSGSYELGANFIGPYIFSPKDEFGLPEEELEELANLMLQIMIHLCIEEDVADISDQLEIDSQEEGAVDKVQCLQATSRWNRQKIGDFIGSVELYDPHQALRMLGDAGMVTEALIVAKQWELFPSALELIEQSGFILDEDELAYLVNQGQAAALLRCQTLLDRLRPGLKLKLLSESDGLDSSTLLKEREWLYRNLASLDIDLAEKLSGALLQAFPSLTTVTEDPNTGSHLFSSSGNLFGSLVKVPSAASSSSPRAQTPQHSSAPVQIRVCELYILLLLRISAVAQPQSEKATANKMLETELQRLDGIYRRNIVLIHCVQFKNYSTAAFICAMANDQVRQLEFSLQSAWRIREELQADSSHLQATEDLILQALDDRVINQGEAESDKRLELFTKLLYYWKELGLSMEPLENLFSRSDPDDEDDVTAAGGFPGEVIGFLTAILCGKEGSLHSSGWRGGLKGTHPILRPAYVAAVRELQFSQKLLMAVVADHFKTTGIERDTRRVRKLLSSIIMNLRYMEPPSQYACVTMEGVEQNGSVVGSLVVFSCGHAYTTEQFKQAVLPELQLRLEKLEDDSYFLNRLVFKQYHDLLEGSHTTDIACPCCVLNSICPTKGYSLSQALSMGPKRW